jgi:hydrogenase maturation protease
MGDVVIIGCGNTVRGDDGAGPMLVRRLAELGVPPGVRLADAGTAGMDVAFQLAGAREVTIVDACQSGAEPGTVFEIHGQDLPAVPLGSANLHALRWDNGLAFGRRLLGDEFPRHVTVFLIEAQSLEPGLGLSRPVEQAVLGLADRLLRRLDKGVPDDLESR